MKSETIAVTDRVIGGMWVEMDAPVEQSLFDAEEQRDDKLYYSYYLALGKFLSKHAEVEAMLNGLVRSYYKIEWETANLALQMLRVDSALQHLQRLIEAKKIPDEDAREIEHLRNQMGQISRFRNDLVHWGIDSLYRPRRSAKTTAPRSKGVTVVVTNTPFAFRKPRSHIVTPEVLLGACRDLSKIYRRIQMLASPQQRQDILEKYGDLLREPWQYTPTQ